MNTKDYRIIQGKVIADQEVGGGETYTAGNGIKISSDNVIALAKDIALEKYGTFKATTITSTNGLEVSDGYVDFENVLSLKTPTLTITGTSGQMNSTTYDKLSFNTISRINASDTHLSYTYNGKDDTYVYYTSTTANGISTLKITIEQSELKHNWVIVDTYFDSVISLSSSETSGTLTDEEYAKLTKNLTFARINRGSESYIYNGSNTTGNALYFSSTTIDRAKEIQIVVATKEWEYNATKPVVQGNYPGETEQIITGKKRFMEPIVLEATGVVKDSDISSVGFYGGTEDSAAGNLILYGKDSTGNKGYWKLQANDGTNSSTLIGTTNGQLLLEGNNIANYVIVGSTTEQIPAINDVIPNYEVAVNNQENTRINFGGNLYSPTLIETNAIRYSSVSMNISGSIKIQGFIMRTTDGVVTNITTKTIS